MAQNPPKTEPADLTNSNWINLDDIGPNERLPQNPPQSVSQSDEDEIRRIYETGAVNDFEATEKVIEHDEAEHEKELSTALMEHWTSLATARGDDFSQMVESMKKAGIVPLDINSAKQMDALSAAFQQAQTQGGGLAEMGQMLADRREAAEQLTAGEQKKDERDEIAEYNGELRKSIEEYLGEHPAPFAPELWEKFKNKSIGAKDFLKECAENLPQEVCTRDIVFLTTVLKSKALHHNADMRTRGAFYAAREMVLNRVYDISKQTPPFLIDEKTVVLNRTELQQLVNVHWDAAIVRPNRTENNPEHKRITNADYITAIEDIRQSVLNCYGGLGTDADEEKKLNNAKKFRAAIYKNGFFGGYQDNEHAALENFHALYGEDCGDKMTEGYRSLVSPNETQAEGQTRKEALVGAWEAEVMVMEKAFGLEQGGLGRASMLNQQPHSIKSAVKIMMKDIGQGALISGGLSLAMGFGVGFLSRVAPGTPAAPILAGVVTAYNVFNQIASAYRAAKVRVQGQKEEGADIGVFDVIKNMDWKKVAINSLITSAPVMLACIPFVGEQLLAAGAIPEATLTGITSHLPAAQMFLSIGLAAKGYVQGLFKARGLLGLQGSLKRTIAKLGVKEALKREAAAAGLATTGAAVNFGAAQLGGELGERGGNYMGDAVKSRGGIAGIADGIAGIADSIAGLAARFAAKLGLIQPDTVQNIDDLAPLQMQSAGSEAEATTTPPGTRENSEQNIAAQSAGKGQQGDSAEGDVDDINNGTELRNHGATDAETHIENEKRISKHMELCANIGLATAVTRIGKNGKEEVQADQYGKIFVYKDNETIKKAAHDGLRRLASLEDHHLNVAELILQIKAHPYLPAWQQSLAAILGMELKSKEFLGLHKLIAEHDWTPIKHEYVDARAEYQKSRGADGNEMSGNEIETYDDDMSADNTSLTAASGDTGKRLLSELESINMINNFVRRTAPEVVEEVMRKNQVAGCLQTFAKNYNDITDAEFGVGL